MIVLCAELPPVGGSFPGQQLLRLSVLAYAKEGKGARACRRPSNGLDKKQPTSGLPLLPRQ